MTSGNHASASGSHEETLSRPDFLREEKQTYKQPEEETVRELTEKAGGKKKKKESTK